MRVSRTKNGSTNSTRLAGFFLQGFAKKPLSGRATPSPFPERISRRKLRFSRDFVRFVHVSGLFLARQHSGPDGFPDHCMHFLGGSASVDKMPAVLLGKPEVGTSDP